MYKLDNSVNDNHCYTNLLKNILCCMTPLKNLYSISITEKTRDKLFLITTYDTRKSHRAIIK